MNSVPKSGKLRDHSVPHVLMSLNRERATGILTVTSKQFTKKVFLQTGEAIFASSNYEDDRLGEMMIKAGKITVEQYDKSVEMLKKTGKRQGMILVELGYMTPKDLYWGVKYQVAEIIYSIFDFEEGEYSFTEEPLKDEVITLKMSMGNMIYEGVRRIENWTRIRREMPSTERVMKLSDDPMSLFQEVELSNQDKKILSLVDGRRPIKKIIEDSWLNSFEALKTLYLLWSLGIITVSIGEAKEAISVADVLSPASLEEEAFIQKVKSLYESVEGMNYFEILELNVDASQEDIKRQYYKLSKEYHPDRFFDATDLETKDMLAGIFEAVKKAHSVLGDERKRREYLESLGKAMEEEAGQIAKAADMFKDANERLKAGDFLAASALLKECARIEPENSEFWNYLALALTRNGDTAGAEKAMKEAIMLNPSNSDYYANLGILYSKLKRANEARMQFQKALMFDPDNKKAQKGMEQLG